MHVKVKFSEGFKDGTIFPDKPKGFAPNELAVLTEAQLAQVRRSGGLFEVVEQVVPNPLKAQKELDAQQPPVLNDKFNAENEINQPDHVPGTEEVVAEHKAALKAKQEKGKRK